MAKHFDDTYHASPGSDVDNFNIGFADIFIGKMDDEWLGDRKSAIRRPPSCAADRALDYASVRINRAVSVFGRFDEHPFFHPGAQVAGQALLQLVGGIENKTGMNVTPILLQVRI